MQLRFAAHRPRHHLAAIRIAQPAIFAVALLCLAPASAQTITTLAGGATCDNASALAVSVEPNATAVDGAGNLYVVATSLHVVCKIAVGGAISRVAGDGTEGFGGDGGSAATARLRNPNGIAVDAGGNLYISDSGNYRIRKVTPAGIISTFAGTGTPGFGGDGGAPATAQFNLPSGLAFDGTGSLYVADTLNNRVRKISGGTVSTVAGSGTAGFSGDGGAATAAQLSSPWGVAVDSGGNLYFADRSNHRVRKVAGGTITTFAGTGTPGFGGDGGPATAAQLNLPHGIAFDAADNLYIADWQNSRIRKIARNGTIGTVSGNSAGFGGDNGPAASARLNHPQDVAVDRNGNLYIADWQNSRVRKLVAADGTIVTAAGNGEQGFSGDGGPATSAQLGSFLNVAADASGNVYVADSNNHRVRKISTDGRISTFAGSGTMGSGGDGGAATTARLNSPNGITFDGAGNLYIADMFNNRIRKVAPDGTITTAAGSGTMGFNGDGGPATAAALSLPTAVGIDRAGNLFIVDSNNQRIRKVALNGTIGTVAGNGSAGFGGDGGPATSAQLYSPNGIAFDRIGNLLIADTANHRVRRVAADGSIGTIAGSGSPGYGGNGGPAVDAALSMPRGMAFDPFGSLFIADWYESVVRKVVPGGTIGAAAGNGVRGFGGDGGPAATALMNSSNSVAFDAAGNLYIADSGNRRIRKIASNLAATTTTLVSAANPSVYGQSVALTATVAGASPAGTVTFAEGAAVLCNAVALTSGTASCTLPAGALSAGTHELTAFYNGDAGNAPSTSALLAQTVNPAATSLAIASIAPGSIVLGQSVTMTTSLAVVAPGTGAPTGIITVGDGSVSCSFSVPANSSCSFTPAGAGARTITATYSGDANFLASTAPTKVVLVNIAPVNGACGTDAGQTLLAAPTHLCRAGNAGAVSGAGHPWAWACAGTNGGSTASCSATIKTWTVSASAGANGTIAPASQTVDHGSTATLTVNAQPGYSAQVAGCSGSLSGTTYATGAVTADCSVAATFTAGPRSRTNTRLALAPNPVNANQAVMATVSVNAGAPPTAAGRSASAQAQPAAVTGSVVVNGGGRQCTAPLAGNGVGSCTLVYTAAGTYAVEASYSGDAQNAPSTDGASLVVNAPPPAPAVAAPALSRWATLALIVLFAALTVRARRQA